jgi:hypothetical protein
MTLYIAPIVEGQTEERCLERLLHRIWGELLVQPERLQVLEPFRGRRDALVHTNGLVLSQTVEKAFLKLQAKAKRDTSARSLLLLLLDAEDDCPAELAPRLLQTCRQAQSNADIACVLAKKMTENWIVAGAAALAGVNGLPAPIQPPEKPEDCNGAAWLDEQLRGVNRNRKYSKTVDGSIFVAKLDLNQCQAKSPSFDKLCRDLSIRPVAAPPANQEPAE